MSTSANYLRDDKRQKKNTERYIGLLAMTYEVLSELYSGQFSEANEAAQSPV